MSLDRTQLAAGERPDDYASSAEIAAFWIAKMRQTLADAETQLKAVRSNVPRTPIVFAMDTGQYLHADHLRVVQCSDTQLWALNTMSTSELINFARQHGSIPGSNQQPA
jgi:capsule polysaccharide export protein KpsE/RkpR